MKYDRPVWQIMYACGAAMPDPFRYEDVHRWFGEHYPEVSQATIRAHLVGMSEGGREKQVQFAHRAPLFRRVARGTYAVIPEAERSVDPDLQAAGGSLKLSAPPSRPDDDATTPAPEPDPDVEPDVPAERASSEPLPVGKQRPDPFAEAAFTDATTVEAGAAQGDTDDNTDEDDEFDRIVASVEAEQGDAGGVDDVTEDETTEQSFGPGRAPDLAPPAFDPIDPDLVLLGSSGERVIVPAPAREIYRDDSFQRSRRACQEADVTWFVLSCEHGLLEPSEWISPDSRSLSDFEPQYRFAWAHWVVARLQSMEGPLSGRTVHVDAPVAFVGPLSAALQDFDALVSIGGATEAIDAAAGAKPMAPTSEAAGEAAAAEPIVRDEHAHVVQPGPEPVPAGRTSHPDPERAAEPAQAASVVQLDPVTTLVEHLTDPDHLIPAIEALMLPEAPGIFAWHVDLPGARVLNRSLMLPVRAGVVFVGQAGGAGGVADPHVAGLRRLLAGVHLGGRSRASTFRGTLATILAGPLRLQSLDDPALTAWMLEHLSVSVRVSDDRDDLRRQAQLLVETLDPRLNIDHLTASAVRRRVSELRAQLA